MHGENLWISVDILLKESLDFILLGASPQGNHRKSTFLMGLM